MARFIGPKARISRKFNEHIFGHCKQLTPARVEADGKVKHKQKNYQPGQHGKGRKKKVSPYAEQLKEKQKAKYIYGVLERQFRNTFERAARKKGVTGENLLQFLEARLDNTVYRLGIAPTRRSARQLVNHRHICVNGEIVNIPSYLLKPGDTIEVREKSKSLEVISDCVGAKNRKYSWLDWDFNLLTGKFLNYPSRDEVPENIKEQFIVELYSK
ncbi:MAG: 30S ribosomal protein S4 [Cytophagales bacterium]|nr:MAG: 30S ribosomal protein S4 [Cytophagales bacterium]TAF60701.1 MAG: 30S ribosomal protein S4 [Cytophagales bacterium]